MDFARALERGACIVFAIGPHAAVGMETGIYKWLANKLKFAIGVTESLEVQPTVTALAPFFVNQTAQAVVGLPGRPDDAHILALALRPDGAAVGSAALRFNYGDADVLLIPVRHTDPPVREQAVLHFLQLLPPREEYPGYLDEVDVYGVGQQRDELAALDARRSEIEVRTRARTPREADPLRDGPLAPPTITSSLFVRSTSNGSSTSQSRGGREATSWSRHSASGAAGSRSRAT
ncbi:MAG: hypothetical protein ACXWZY_08220 [Gaiellaceae bacterium]